MVPFTMSCTYLPTLADLRHPPTDMPNRYGQSLKQTIFPNDSRCVKLTKLTFTPTLEASKRFLLLLVLRILSFRIQFLNIKTHPTWHVYITFQLIIWLRLLFSSLLTLTFGWSVSRVSSVLFWLFFSSHRSAVLCWHTEKFPEWEFGLCNVPDC